MSRPITYTDKKVTQIKKDLEKYIEETELPQIAHFAYLYKIRRQTLYELDGLSDTIENLNAKKEYTLFKKGLEGDYNSQIVKLGLGQMGYHEKTDTQHTTIDENGETTGFKIEFVKAK